MSADRSLVTLLRSLQYPASDSDVFRLLPSATTLLSILTNPNNVTLLSSQLLSAPALWSPPVTLQTCRQILSIYNTVAITILQRESTDNSEPRLPPYYNNASSNPRPREGILKEEWIKAAVNGADEKSPRWRHLLLLGGILLGFEGSDRQGLPGHLRSKLESALVNAANLALQEELSRDNDVIAGYCVALVLNHTFPLLSDFERSQVEYDLLLPILVDATFFSREGLQSGYFVGTIDRDVVQAGTGEKFVWSAKSETYVRIRAIGSSPLISSLGPLSRLIAHSAENVRDPGLVLSTMDRLLEFARTLTVQWRQNKLSEVDASEEAEFLEQESLKITVPVLWQLLRTSMFASIIILRAVLGRTLGDPVLAAGKNAPFLAMQTLHILRNLYFISSRIGQNSSSQYVFANLTAIDILTQYPLHAENFLRSIRPSEQGQIPAHPVDRCLDLFFLNTAEHFTLILPPQTNEDLLIASALPYLAAGGNNHLLPIFEAAHSVTLAVLAAPQSTTTTTTMASKHLPFYIDALFRVFPANLSPRQFRLAFKTVVKITSPPSPLATSNPLLPSILLDLVYDRAISSSSTTTTTPLPPPPTDQNLTDPPLSEQAVLVLTLIDSLCYVPVPVLEEWLPLAAQAVNQVPDPDMRRVCQDRFWDAMSSGEMDIERAAFCVAWWSTRGGREMLLFGDEGLVGGGGGNGSGEKYLMSGALELAGEQDGRREMSKL